MFKTMFPFRLMTSCLYLLIVYTSPSKKFTIGSIYRPGIHPSLSSLVQFNEFIEISSHVFEKCRNLKS
jgi:hypothetical protein